VDASGHDRAVQSANGHFLRQGHDWKLQAMPGMAAAAISDSTRNQDVTNGMVGSGETTAAHFVDPRTHTKTEGACRGYGLFVSKQRFETAHLA